MNSFYGITDNDDDAGEELGEVQLGVEEYDEEDDVPNRFFGEFDGPGIGVQQVVDPRSYRSSIGSQDHYGPGPSDARPNEVLGDAPFLGSGNFNTQPPQRIDTGWGDSVQDPYQQFQQQVGTEDLNDASSSFHPLARSTRAPSLVSEYYNPQDVVFSKFPSTSASEPSFTYGAHGQPHRPTASNSRFDALHSQPVDSVGGSAVPYYAPQTPSSAPSSYIPFFNDPTKNFFKNSPEQLMLGAPPSAP